jgi:hypothetical protein
VPQLDSVDRLAVDAGPLREGLLTEVHVAACVANAFADGSPDGEYSG